MFKDLFPNKVNRLVYQNKGPERAASAPSKKAKTKNDRAAEIARVFDNAVRRAPESPKQKKAREWSDAILKATGTRKRFERISAKDSRELVNSTAAQIERFMAGKKKEALPVAADGTTLLLERKGAGIMAVVVESGARVGGPNPPTEFIVIGNVSRANEQAVAMAEEYRNSPLGKKQAQVAARFHAGHEGLMRRVKERAIYAAES